MGPKPRGGRLPVCRGHHVAWSHQLHLWGGKPVHNGNSSQYNVEKQFQESFLFSFRSQGKQLELLFFVGQRKKLRSTALIVMEFFSRPKMAGMLGRVISLGVQLVE